MEKDYVLSTSQIKELMKVIDSKIEKRIKLSKKEKSLKNAFKDSLILQES
jgi:hypothetical protein